MLSRLAAQLTLLSLFCLSPSIARADDGAWFWVEYRQRLWDAPPNTPRLSLRLFSDTRFSTTRGVLQQFLRVGPVFDVTSWFVLAVHGTVYADRQADDRFQPEARLELEPTFQVQLGPIHLADRNRLEYRWRETVQRVRYRNQLRVRIVKPGWVLQPFVWNEFLFDLSAGFNENRLLMGVGFKLTENITLDLGYQLRSRVVANEWVNDHLAVAYLFINVPRAKTR